MCVLQEHDDVLVTSGSVSLEAYVMRASTPSLHRESANSLKSMLNLATYLTHQLSGITSTHHSSSLLHYTLQVSLRFYVPVLIYQPSSSEMLPSHSVT